MAQRKWADKDLQKGKGKMPKVGESSRQPLASVGSDPPIVVVSPERLEGVAETDAPATPGTVLVMAAHGIVQGSRSHDPSRSTRSPEGHPVRGSPALDLA